MPSAPRMSKRLSQAPRLSVVMAGEDGLEGRKHDSVREFFTNHIKTIVTLVMIFGTIACIVLIVMVHKWRFESNRAEEIAACLDVAVIGAGLSGSYASWRMRTDSLSKIHLFEYSDRVGGRLHTRRLGHRMKAEMGALYYLPQRHQLLNRTIHALRLTPSGSYPPSPDLPTYYFRDQLRKRTGMNSRRGNLAPVYNPQNMERDKTPEELKRFYTESYLEDIHVDPLKVRFQNTNLYEMRYWTFLNAVASREGFNFVQDGTRYRSHVSNGNAALLASLDLDTWDVQYTIEEGMDALPKAMVEQFANSSENHEVHFNRRLACVHREHEGIYRLIFQKTVTKDGVTTSQSESEKVCAQRLILAVSPAALKGVRFTGFGEDAVSPSDLADQFLEPVPAMTAYFTFDKQWWDGLNPPIQDVVTDLPIRHVRYVGSEKPSSSSSKQHLFMVASPDWQDVDYFNPLISENGSIALHHSNNITMQSLRDLKSQLAKVQGLNDASGIPDPVQAVVEDWRREPFGAGWHMWKAGVNWDKSSRCLEKPFHEEEIYVIGGDVCPGTCQFWAEGALQTVEDLFVRHNSTKLFQKAAMAPIAGDDDDDVLLVSPTNSSAYQNI